MVSARSASATPMRSSGPITRPLRERRSLALQSRKSGSRGVTP